MVKGWVDGLSVFAQVRGQSKEGSGLENPMAGMRVRTEEEAGAYWGLLKQQVR